MSDSPTADRRRRSLATRLRNVLMPVATLAVILGLWHAAIVWFEVPRYQAPSPVDVAKAFFSQGEAILSATLVTGASALIGFRFDRLRSDRRALRPASVQIGCRFVRLSWPVVSASRPPPRRFRRAR